jgi:HK97 family phage prohead protease
MDAFRRLATNNPIKVDADSGLVTFIFNTEEVARDDHVIRNRGIRTANFKKNPVILWAHDAKSPPIGRAVSVDTNGTQSSVVVEFTSPEVYPFGATIGELVRGGFINACSMSWNPLKWHYSTDKSRSGGIDFDEVDLLEISVVPVPALPAAIATARAAGIDTSLVEQMLRAQMVTPASTRVEARFFAARRAEQLHRVNATIASGAEGEHLRAAYRLKTLILRDAG